LTVKQDKNEKYIPGLQFKEKNDQFNDN